MEAYFHVEERDQPIQDDPEKHVLQQEGALLVLVADPDPSVNDPRTAVDQTALLQPTDVLATCALIPYQQTSVKLAKMTVAPTARGRGLGRRLLRAAPRGRSHGIPASCAQDKPPPVGSRYSLPIGGVQGRRSRSNG